MAQQNSSEEIDLGTIFDKVRDGYHGLLISFYRGVQFLLRNWIIIVVLILAGGVIGYLLDNKINEAKETTLLVQLNFDSANYVYGAIEQLNKKIEENDTEYLIENGFLDNDKNLISSVEIEPVVNIMDILKNTTSNDGYISALFEQSKFEDNILTSEILIPEYKSHKIALTTTVNDTDKVVSGLLAYLNDNGIYNRLKVVAVENTKNIIEKNKASVVYLDSMFKAYGTLMEDKTQSSQVYFNSYEVNNGNIHLMFQQKRNILGENEELETELIKYDNIVELLNKPRLQVKKGLFNNKILLLPIIFVFGFIILAFIRKIYLKAKKLNLSKV
jgi:hypothetical protein